MYDRSTKILSAFTVGFLFLFLTEFFPLTGGVFGTENSVVTETASVNGKAENYKEKDEESQEGVKSHTKDERNKKENTNKDIDKNEDKKTNVNIGVKNDVNTEIVRETGKLRESTSEPRVIEEQTLIKKRIASLSADEFDVLCRIVQAEAGGEDALGKQMVADVIINRVCSRKFPNSVSGVVFQQSGGKAQFSPVRDGRYYSVTVTSDTRAAVTNALNGSDSTNGALYFVNASKANPGNLSWFENCLTFQVEHGGHRFYR